MNDCLNIIATTVFRQIFFKELAIIPLGNLQGINPIGLSAPWADYNNKHLFTNMKM